MNIDLAKSATQLEELMRVLGKSNLRKMPIGAGRRTFCGLLVTGGLGIGMSACGFDLSPKPSTGYVKPRVTVERIWDSSAIFQANWDQSIMDQRQLFNLNPTHVEKSFSRAHNQTQEQVFGFPFSHQG